jgi:hypothetical protein
MYAILVAVWHAHAGNLCAVNDQMKTVRIVRLVGGSIFPSGGCSTAPQIGTQDMTICQRLESPTAGNACEPELSG